MESTGKPVNEPEVYNAPSEEVVRTYEDLLKEIDDLKAVLQHALETKQGLLEGLLRLRRLYESTMPGREALDMMLRMKSELMWRDNELAVARIKARAFDVIAGFAGRGDEGAVSMDMRHVLDKEIARFENKLARASMNTVDPDAPPVPEAEGPEQPA